MVLPLFDAIKSFDFHVGVSSLAGQSIEVIPVGFNKRPCFLGLNFSLTSEEHLCADALVPLLFRLEIESIHGCFKFT